MAQWRERMRPYYYDPGQFDTYLEQLGIEYPVIRTRPVSDDEGGPGGVRR
jgi:aminobenzoyl-glutamate utilization protein B